MWLFLPTCLFSPHLEVSSWIIFTITFPGIQETNPQLSWSFFLSFLKIGMTFHRVRKVGKISKIIQSNSQLTTIIPLNHVIQCNIYPFLENLQGQWLHHVYGQSVIQCFTPPNNFFLISTLNLPWHLLSFSSQRPPLTT